jgi:hypothetical protein
VKNSLYIFGLFGLLASCTATRSGSAVRHKPNPVSDQPKFIENIVIRPSAELHDEGEAEINMPKRIRGKKDVPGSVYSTDIEKCNEVQFKYAILMDEEVEAVTNHKLISFLEDWYGTPYKYGGSAKTGIDCSAFTCVMMDTVYGISLPRTSREQYSTGKKVSKSALMHGDLVFFNTTGGISHVGVYLGNNKFIHASTSSGVMISDLDDVYFKRRYVGATRMR